eukprot:12049719-Alexandrium_andersonii.AAC.1
MLLTFGPSSPNGPEGPPCGSEAAVYRRTDDQSDPGAGGTARSAAHPAIGREAWRGSAVVDSERRRG